jgi:hypothetical protein
MIRTRENRWESKGLHINDCRHDIESEEIKYLLEIRLEIRDKASIIVYYSAVKDEEEGGRLFIKEICSSGT